MCPHCRQNAPLVYRGINAYCAACGRSRSMLSASSLTHAGKPAQLGGSVVGVFGWVVLAFGLFVASLLGLIAGLVWTAGTGLVTFALLALFPAVFFLLLRKGGKALSEAGQETQEHRREQALFALAANNAGVVQAVQVAGALDMTVADADAYLTRLAKTRPDEVDLEIGDQGEVLYTFPQFFRGRRVRIGTVGAGAPWPSEVASVARPAPPSGEARRVIDAEFEAIEEAAAAGPARARRS